MGCWITFRALDVPTIYQRLFDAPDAATREAIFSESLVTPFMGVVQQFGGEGLASFAQWGMRPDHFAPEHAARTQAVVAALSAADAWSRAAASLERGCAAFAPFADRLPLKEVTFALLVNEVAAYPGAADYSGYDATPGWIMTTYAAATEANLRCVEAATVHELHHNLLGAYLRSAFPEKTFLTMTVADYMVMEGLAESFAGALYGQDKIGPWVTGFDMSRLDHTKAAFREGLTRTGFNVLRGYIFGGEVATQYGGANIDVPQYAGYTLGYHVVQAYLQRTGKSVMEASFTLAEEIVEESRYLAVTG